MITQEEINNLTNFELDELIKMCRKAQKKDGPIILNLFKNFTEPDKNYTLNDLYNIYTDMNKGERISVSKSSFNLAIIRYLDSGDLKLKNLKIKQQKKPSKKELGLVGVKVDNFEI
jgi:hypothetical protein